MIRRLVICAFFSLLSVLHAAPVNHGDNVWVTPGQAINKTPRTSSPVVHRGVVVGGPNELNNYQVAVVTTHPPPNIPHEKLTTFHPSARVPDPVRSKIGTGEPMIFSGDKIKARPNTPSLSQTETSNLQNKIKINTGQPTWPAHNQRPGSSSKPTFKTVATAALAAIKMGKLSPSGDKQTPVPPPSANKQTPVPSPPANKQTSPPLQAGPSRQPSLLNNPPVAASNRRGASNSNVKANAQARRYNPISTTGRRGGKP